MKDNKIHHAPDNRLSPDCFYDEAVYEFLKEDGMDVINQYNEDQQRWHELIEEVGISQYDGLTLKSLSYDQWLILSPEPQAVDGHPQFRYTLFDGGGFISHQTFDSEQAALVEAFNNGFVLLCANDTLDEMARHWQNLSRPSMG